MDQLMTVRGMRERYGCSNQTARKYLRMCNPHTENPLTAPVWAVEEWEDSRISVPVEMPRAEKRRINTGRVIVPRNW